MAFLKILRSILSFSWIVLLPLSIYLGTSMLHFKKTSLRLEDKVSELTSDLAVANGNIERLKFAMDKQNNELKVLSDFYNEKTKAYQIWLKNTDLSKYGEKANLIFKTDDFNKKIELLKGLGIH